MLVTLFWLLGVPFIISMLCTPTDGNEFTMTQQFRAAFEYTTVLVLFVLLLMASAYFI